VLSFGNLRQKRAAKACIFSARSASVMFAIAAPRSVFAAPSSA